MTMKLDWMRGCATALVTPFKPDGSIDEERMRALVDRQINGGVKLLVPCGTTGESATMSEEEDARVIGMTIDVARGRARVIAGAGSNSTASAIDYSKRARELGADAVLQVAPWYNKPTQEGLYAHFRAIAEAAAEIAGRTVSGQEGLDIIAASVADLRVAGGAIDSGIGRVVAASVVDGSASCMTGSRALDLARRLWRRRCSHSVALCKMLARPREVRLGAWLTASPENEPGCARSP